MADEASSANKPPQYHPEEQFMLKRIASAVVVAASLAAFSIAGIGTATPANGVVSARIPGGCC